MRGSLQASHLRGVCDSIARIVVIPYRRNGVAGGRDCRGSMARIRTLRCSSCVPKSPLGLTPLTPPARKNFPSPPRRSARDALPYVCLCVCSSSLLARS